MTTRTHYNPTIAKSDTYLAAVAHIRGKGLTVSASSWEDAERGNYAVYSNEQDSNGNPLATVSGTTDGRVIQCR